MAHPDGLSQWTATVAKELTPLSPAQARVLALWSYGMVLTQSCACHTIAVFLGLCSGEGYHALRQRLREWCYDASDKRGLNRQAVDVTVCFAPLLAWVMRLWAGSQVTLALDATSLGERFVVLTISVVYRGCAIPVAWKVLPAQGKRAWRREWLRLIRLLRPAIPPERTVIVLADRGLYRPLCTLAVPAHRARGLAPLPARQHGGQVPPRRAGTVGLAARPRSPSRHHLAWPRHRLCLHQVSPRLHARRLLGARLSGPLVHPDRPLACGLYGLVVWRPRLD